MTGLVQIAEFFDANQAELARAELESAGFAAKVFVEDLALQGPRRGRLMVPGADVVEACEMLGYAVPETPAEGFLDRNASTLFAVLLTVAAVGIVAFIVRFL